MSLIEKIEATGMDLLFDMRGRHKTTPQFWRDFNALGSGDYALFNVYAMTTRQPTPLVATGANSKSLEQMLEICQDEDITPVLQYHPVSGANNLQHPNTVRFLLNARAIIRESGIKEYLIITDNRRHLPVLQELWKDELGRDVGTAFRSKISDARRMLGSTEFDPSTVDVDLFTLQLPGDLQARENIWPETLTLLELARTRLDNPVRAVMIDPSWPDAGLG